MRKANGCTSTHCIQIVSWSDLDPLLAEKSIGAYIHHALMHVLNKIVPLFSKDKILCLESGKRSWVWILPKFNMPVINLFTELGLLEKVLSTQCYIHRCIRVNPNKNQLPFNYTRQQGFFIYRGCQFLRPCVKRSCLFFNVSSNLLLYGGESTRR